MSNQAQDFSDIEYRLQRSLKPVTPRADFIVDLRQQLANQLEMLPSISRFGRSSVVWLVLLLIFLILGVFLLSIRVMLLLISALTLLGQFSQQDQKKLDRTLPSGK